MIDPAVERQYSDSKELLALWRTFHDFFVMGIKGENISPEKEAQFLEIKSRIAMLHDSFMDALSHDQNIGQEILNIITRAITLKHLSKQSPADGKKMEIEWHESYLLLNETIGTLEDKRAELGRINETQYRASKAAGVLGQKARNFFGSFYFKLTVGLIVFFGATVGVQMLGIYDYNDLGRIPALRTPYQTAKAVFYHFNPDSPWPTIDSVPRKPYTGWPVGFKPPEIKADAKKEDIISQLSGVTGVPENLEKATEYRKEVTSKEFKGTIEIHSFLLPDAATARTISDAWEAYTQTPEAGKRFERRIRIARNVNYIVVIKADSYEITDTIRDGVFPQNR
jgi:hypothetical protein